MSIDSRYKEEMESFCRRTYKVGGEEMLQMAKRSTINITDSTSGKKRLTKKALLIPIAAAVFGMTAVTAAAGAAGYGPLSGMFGKYFGDSVTEKLAEEGYVYTADDYAADSAAEQGGGERVYPVMGEALTKDIFTARVVGFAGDTQCPLMLVDITVNDRDIAEKNDIIGAYILTLGAEQFDKDRDSYFIEYAKGVKDEAVPDLYHVSVSVPPVWVTSGEEMVVDIVSVHVLNDNNNGIHEYYRDQEVSDRGVSTVELLEHGGLSEYHQDEQVDMSVISGWNYYDKLEERSVEMQFRFTIPENIFKAAAEHYYDDPEMIYQVNEYPYHLTYSEFGAHKTCITLDFDAGSGTPPESFNEDEHNLLAARTVAEKFTLTVDGKDFAPLLDDLGVFCDTEGSCNLCVKDRCYICMSFPAVDIENAQSITLSAGGKSYELTGCDTMQQ